MNVPATRGPAELARLDDAALVTWGVRRLEAAGEVIADLKKAEAEFKAVEAYAKALAKAMDDGKGAQQACVELVLRCERKLQLALKGVNRKRRGRPPKKTPHDGGFSDETPTLGEMGLDERHATRAAVLAEVTPEQFEAGITALRKRGELTQAAMIDLMGAAMAGGMGMDEIEASVTAEEARRPKAEPVKLTVDLSPAATAIFGLEDFAPMKMDPEACAAAVGPVVRRSALALAHRGRDWLDIFITTLEGRIDRGET